MGSYDGLSEGDHVEAHLLTDPVSQGEYEESVDGGRILYRAKFENLERIFLNYETAQWILISLLLILAWGVGILLLVYTPVRRYVMRKDFRSRKLYITPNALVYKVTRPVFLPCLGVSKIEKHILLPLITDITVEQGCLQSAFGIYSIRIETLGQGSALGARDLHICGLEDPRHFREAVLIAAASCRQEGPFTMGTVVSSPKAHDATILGLPRQDVDTGSQTQTWSQQRDMLDYTTWQMSHPLIGGTQYAFSGMPEERLFRKLEDVGNALKRIEILIERQHFQIVEDTISQKSDREERTV